MALGIFMAFDEATPHVQDLKMKLAPARPFEE
jgi:hypothetical protein